MTLNVQRCKMDLPSHTLTRHCIILNGAMHIKTADGLSASTIACSLRKLDAAYTIIVGIKMIRMHSKGRKDTERALSLVKLPENGACVVIQ